MLEGKYVNSFHKSTHFLYCKDTCNAVRCLDESCIPLSLRCDGVTDCVYCERETAPDEANCGNYMLYLNNNT